MQLYFLALIAVFALDRITKLLISSKMEVFQTIAVIEGFFHITYIRNPGAAFGMLANMRWVFIAITIAIVAVMFYMALKMSHQRFLVFILGIISGVALGNLVDRVQTGLVVDFLDFRGIWPYIFNVADSAVVVGVILLTWKVIRSDEIM